MLARVWPYLSSIQRACTIFLSVASMALLYFSILSHKRQDFRKKVTEHKMYVLVFSTTFT